MVIYSVNLLYVHDVKQITLVNLKKTLNRAQV